MERYFLSGIAPSTNRVYTAGIKKYLALCEQLHTAPLPATEQLLCKFSAHLATNNISSSSIKVYLSAVRQLHVSKGLPPPRTDDMARLQQVLRGIKITQGRQNNSTTPRHRNPISVEVLQDIWSLWSKQPRKEDRTMLWAAFTTCFFGFMRVGELCTHDNQSFDATSGLLADDISVDNITDPNLIRIHLKVSKTDQFT